MIRTHLGITVDVPEPRPKEGETLVNYHARVEAEERKLLADAAMAQTGKTLAQLEAENKAAVEKEKAQ